MQLTFNHRDAGSNPAVGTKCLGSTKVSAADFQSVDAFSRYVQGSKTQFNASVAQLARASPCHGEGYEIVLRLMLHKLPDSQAQTVRDAR